MADVSVFVAYAREDQKYVDEIKRLFNPRQLPGVQLWTDDYIDAGERWNEVIETHLNSANIVLLIVSQDFLNSTYIQTRELPLALKRSNLGECKVIPVFARRTVLEPYTEITALQGIENVIRFLNEMGEQKDSYYTALQIKLGDYAKEASAGKIGILTRNKIFISIPDSPEGILMRQQLLKTLELKKKHEGTDKWPYEIVPSISEASLEQLSSTELSTILNAEFNSCLYSIHIVGTSDELTRGRSLQQIQMNGVFKKIIWLANTEFESALDDSLKKNPIVKGDDLVKLLNVIKSMDDRRDDKLTSFNKIIRSKKKIFLCYDFNVDQGKNLCRKIIQGIAKKELDLRLGLHAENRQSEEKALEDCDGAVIYYGASDQQWCVSKQSLFLAKPNLRIKAVCVDEPDALKKVVDVITPFFSTIEAGSFDHDIDDFLNGF